MEGCWFSRRATPSSISGSLHDPNKNVPAMKNRSVFFIQFRLSITIGKISPENYSPRKCIALIVKNLLALYHSVRATFTAKSQILPRQNLFIKNHLINGCHILRKFYDSFGLLNFPVVLVDAIGLLKCRIYTPQGKNVSCIFVIIRARQQ